MLRWIVRASFVIAGAWLQAGIASSTIALIAGPRSPPRPNSRHLEDSIRELDHYMQPIVQQNLFENPLADLERTAMPISRCELASDQACLIGHCPTSVRVVPYFEGGYSRGFRIYSVQPESLARRLGFLTGDIVTTVNGYSVDSPEKALQLYGLLKDEKVFTVDLIRQGLPKRLVFLDTAFGKACAP